MSKWRISTIGTLLVCLSFLPVGDCALWAKAAAAAPVARTWETVNLLGEGAKVKIKLTDGAKLKGVIQSYGEEGFVLSGKDSQQLRTIEYDQIAELKPAKRSYKASGPTDPVAARGAVVGLGVGEHIKVKFDGNRVLHGNITAIGADRFTIHPDRQQAPVEIAYNNVQLVHENLSAGATLAIVLGIAGVVALLAVVLTDSDTVRGSF